MTPWDNREGTVDRNFSVYKFYRLHPKKSKMNLTFDKTTFFMISFGSKSDVGQRVT